MKNKPNPDYIDAPYECVGELNGVSFVISEKCPNTALCIWIKMPDRIPMIFDVLDGKWVETSVKQSWFKQLPFFLRRLFRFIGDLIPRDTITNLCIRCGFRLRESNVSHFKL